MRPALDTERFMRIRRASWGPMLLVADPTSVRRSSASEVCRAAQARA